ncbi:hypothetical protein [Flavicella sediminum]|nr:hypothetical protein [Flavicella sediminum]
MYEISFQNGLMLSASIPKSRTEKKKEKEGAKNDLFTILGKAK